MYIAFHCIVSIVLTKHKECRLPVNGCYLVWNCSRYSQQCREPHPGFSSLPEFPVSESSLSASVVWKLVGWRESSVQSVAPAILGLVSDFSKELLSVQLKECSMEVWRKVSTDLQQKVEEVEGIDWNENKSLEWTWDVLFLRFYQKNISKNNHQWATREP